MKFIAFDIETQGIRDAALALAEPFKLFEPLPPFDPKAVKVGNLKDPDKIAAKIRAEEEAYPQRVKEHEDAYEKARVEYTAKVVSKAALNALTGRVVAIGIKTADEEKILSGNEAEILRGFWEIFAMTPCAFVGWNIGGFDVPFMVRRSWANGVIVPNIYNGRYLDKRFVDLMEVFGCGEYGYKAKLDDVANFLGVQGKYDGDCTGEEFAEKFLSGDDVARAQAEEYLKCDVRATWAIAEKLFTAPKKEEVENEFC